VGAEGLELFCEPFAEVGDRVIIGMHVSAM